MNSAARSTGALDRHDDQGEICRVHAFEPASLAQSRRPESFERLACFGPQAHNQAGFEPTGHTAPLELRLPFRLGPLPHDIPGVLPIGECCEQCLVSFIVLMECIKQWAQISL